jgi:purine-binding chemotaxis protein CheW
MPLSHVVEIMRPLPLQAIAGTEPFVAGAAVIRGLPTPVVDCGALLGQLTPPAPTRWATIRCKGGVAALAFEQVLGVHPLSQVEDLPPLLRGSDAVAAIASVDAELVLVLASTRLVPDSLWQSLGNQVATP